MLFQILRYFPSCEDDFFHVTVLVPSGHQSLCLIILDILNIGLLLFTLGLLLI